MLLAYLPLSRCFVNDNVYLYCDKKYTFSERSPDIGYLLAPLRIINSDDVHFTF